ncbi:hypothetical protein CC1G_06203 [Coprinopsis cinerea okayama7|uniref:F-box domain-containing protein n=1 Tax=Coprinopsis cinerea (strain Okayama-7 / 130 / ATCC MYA-4618 / FGSC 9003) TaxID=240176 RepID=A8NV74_COPC7|nr:hypothetical protein CC1G_06203 [Coprinopsis cinerea okayama7\|eukprot:XP_001836616.1 hypothetical protein CC1G_06203 [Coprinopsis cinerea okayama7\
MPDLPYELWLHVLRYVPKDRHFNLRRVNRTIYNIILDERYREGRIHYLAERKTQKLLKALQFSHQIVVDRVRSLYLRPHSLPIDDPQAHLLLQSLKEFTNLTSLDLYCCHSDEYTKFIEKSIYIVPALKVYSSRLQSLQLQIPLEAYKGLQLSTIHFSNLRELHIHVFTPIRAEGKTVSASEAGILCDFVNLQKDTIEELKLSNLSSLDEDADESLSLLTIIFENPAHLPRLSTFELSAFLTGDSSAKCLRAVERFLVQYKTQLQKISLSLEPFSVTKGFKSSDWDLVPRILSIPFSTLTTLHLDLLGGPKISALSSCVSQHALHDFSLKGKFLNFSEAEKLVEALQGDALKSLSILPQRCGPDLLLLLMAKLPNLHTLYLGFDLWTQGGRDDDPSVGSGPHQTGSRSTPYSKLFCLAILECGHLFTNWKLRHLRYDVFGHSDWNGRWCKSALAIVLSGVETINGEDRQSLIEDPEYLKSRLLPLDSQVN